MIPNQWYAVLESNEVKPGKALAVTRMGEQLAVWRDSQGNLSIMKDQCPHRGAALSPGKIINDCLECPFHGFQFDHTGQGKFIPANGKNTPVPKVFHAHTYPSQEAHGFIWMWWGEERESYPPLPWFENLNEDDYLYSTLKKNWNVHYSRAIENQLDVSHLPFVHKNTIGRGEKTLVNGPYVTLEDDLMQVWVDNQKDAGIPPTKPTKMPEPKRPALLWFRFPNLWQNRISEKLSIMVAFVPVDEANTMMYVRFYQRFMKAPLLGRTIAQLGAVMNRFVLREDERVVVTQRPVKSDLYIGEKFIPGDRPIALYLTRRRQLLEAVEAGSGETIIAQADKHIDWDMIAAR